MVLSDIRFQLTEICPCYFLPPEASQQPEKTCHQYHYNCFVTMIKELYNCPQNSWTIKTHAPATSGDSEANKNFLSDEFDLGA